MPRTGMSPLARRLRGILQPGVTLVAQHEDLVEVGQVEVADVVDEVLRRTALLAEHGAEQGAVVGAGEVVGVDAPVFRRLGAGLPVLEQKDAAFFQGTVDGFKHPEVGVLGCERAEGECVPEGVDGVALLGGELADKFLKKNGFGRIYYGTG